MTPAQLYHSLGFQWNFPFVPRKTNTVHVMYVLVLLVATGSWWEMGLYNAYSETIILLSDFSGKVMIQNFKLSGKELGICYRNQCLHCSVQTYRPFSEAGKKFSPSFCLLDR
jgi:hypothetical protein